MSDAAQEVKTEPQQPVDADGNLLKPCCVCLDEKKAMEACILEKGEENCQDLLEAHSACLRKLGFEA